VAQAFQPAAPTFESAFWKGRLESRPCGLENPRHIRRRLKYQIDHD